MYIPFQSVTLRIRILLLALMAIVISLAFVVPRGTVEPNGMYIAYIGKYKNPEFDLVHERALRLLVRQKDAGLPQLSLRSFSIARDDPALVYQRLQKDADCIAVIDNTWGSDIARAADAISQGTLPVISINADKAGIQYNNKAIFLGHDDATADATLNYLEHMHPDAHVVLIGEKHYWSTPQFKVRLTHGKMGVSTEHIHCVDDKTPTEKERGEVTDFLVKHAHEASSLGKELIIVLNVHLDWGMAILEKVESSYLPNKSPFEGAMIMGGTYIYSSMASYKFSGQHGVKLLLVTSPRDSLSSLALRLDEHLRATHRETALVGGSTAFYIQRCTQAIDIIRTMAQPLTTHKADPAGMRARMLGTFSQLRNSPWVLPDATLKFDKDLKLIKPAQLELRTRSGTRSNPHQLSTDGEIIPNVSVGIKVVDIRQISLDDGSFFAEFYLSLQYDKAYADQLGDLGRRLFFPNSRENVIIENMLDNHLGPSVSLYRCTGVFSANFDIEQFPFDAQFLPIRVALRDTPQPDTANPTGPKSRTPVALSFDADFHQGRIIPLGHAIAPGWIATDARTGVEESTSYSGGNSSGGQQPVRLVQLTASISLKRSILRPLATIVLPLVGIGACSIALLFLKNLALSHVGEISVGIFLALVAYAISFTQFAPNGSTITRADWLFWSTATVATAQLFFVIVGNVCWPDKMQSIRPPHWNLVFPSIIFVAYATALFFSLLV